MTLACTAESNAATKKYQVLIVGCGPTGATLANLLRRYGHSVAIFDRDKNTFAVPRAMQMDPSSCRIFQSLGIQKQLEENDARPALRHIFVDKNRKPLFEYIAEEDKADYGYHVGGVRFHQPSLERLLRDGFNEGVGVDAYLGYEVIEVEGEGGQAGLRARNVDTGQIETFEADYLIGADGGSSSCRQYVGAERVDFNYSRQWIVMDMLIHDQALWDSFIDRSEFRCRQDAAVVFVKGHHNHVRLDFEVSEAQAETFSKRNALALISEYFDPSTVEFQRMVPYHFYAGMPARWRKGRVLLAGDAAHLTSPFLGQGMNMGIRDAANLAFKLDLILKGCADDRLMDSYEDERWENCEKIIKGATERGLMISTESLRGVLGRTLLFGFAKLFPKIAVTASRRANVGVPYNNGIVGEHGLAGYQCIQPQLSDAQGDLVMMDDLIGHRFALVCLSSETPTFEQSASFEWFKSRLNGVFLKSGEDFFDHTEQLSRYMKKHKAAWILLRPDRYIFDAGASPEELLNGLITKMRRYSCECRDPRDKVAELRSA